MGGLWRKMPWTTATWVIGALSLAGIPPLAGFWSKDEILLVAYTPGTTTGSSSSRSHGGAHRVLHGPRHLPGVLREAGPGQSKSAHAHESRWVMTGPLVVLATLAVSAGLVGSPLADFAFGTFLGEHARRRDEPDARGHRRRRRARRHRATRGPCTSKGDRARLVHAQPVRRDALLSRHFRIDDVYQAFLVRPVMALAELLPPAGLRRRRRRRARLGAIGLAVSRFSRPSTEGRSTAPSTGSATRVVGAGREVRAIADRQRADVPVLLLVVSIVVLVLVFAR